MGVKNGKKMASENENTQEKSSKVEGGSKATLSKMEQNRSSWRSRKSERTTPDVAPCRKKCES